MAQEVDSQALQQLLDERAITRVLNLYCRGIDRCDLETLNSAFWPDGTADYSGRVENAAQWCKETIPAMLTMRRTMHNITNCLIEWDGERASGETCCLAYHEMDTEWGLMEVMVGGRYLDRFEKRSGEWRISSRVYVMDWNRNVPSTCLLDKGMYVELVTRGSRYPTDPSYLR